MRIFEFGDYREYLKEHLKGFSKGGRGQLRKISEHLRVHTTLVSQVFRGRKSFTLEQAAGVAKYLGLMDLETRYLLTLVQIERAGTLELKNIYETQAKELKEQGLKLSQYVSAKKELTETERLTFYSNWYYSAIRLAASIPDFQTPEQIADRLDIPLSLVTKAAHFLVESGLCLRENEKIQMGPSRTFIEATSPLVRNHHVNWRLKTMEKFAEISPEEVVFTGPMSLSAKDFVRLRSMITQFVKEVSEIVEESPAEELACLNIDFLKI